MLTEAGYRFDIEPADLDENDLPPGLSPAGVAGFLARSKAMKLVALHGDAVVLGADTVVAVGDVMYGKADTCHDARAMLIALGGRRQEVLTGVSLCRANRPPETFVERSIVAMRAMTDAELDAYLASDQWRGKAGGYGIQDHDPASDPFVKLIDGEMTNVVGLPMGRVRRMLEDVGIRGR